MQPEARKALPVLYGVSASALPRVAKCALSAALPQSYSESEQADEGRAVHSFLERVVNAVREGSSLAAARATALLAATPEMRATCALLDLERLPITRASEAEVRVAYHVERGTARRLGPEERADRNVELPVQIDLVDGAHGVDWKTGRPRGQVKDDWQMRLTGLAIARLADLGDVKVTRARLDKRTGERWLDDAVFDVFDLDSFEEDIRVIAWRVRDARGKLASKEHVSATTGSHCGYCRALTHCPEMRNAIGMALLPGAWDLALVSTDAVRAAWERCDTVEAAVKAVRSACYAYAGAVEPVPLGGGRVLGPHDKWGNRNLDGRKAFDIIAREFGRETAERAVDYAATQAGMRAALADLADDRRKGLSTAASMRLVMAELEEKGGVTRKRSLGVVEVHEPRATEPEEA